MTDFLNGLGWPLLALGVVIFIATAFIVYGLSTLFAEESFFQRRLGGLAGGLATKIAPGRVSVLLDDDTLLKKYDHLVAPQDEAERSRIRNRLMRAGYRKPGAVRMFYLAKGVFALGLTILFAIVVPILPFDLPIVLQGALVIFGTLIGYVAPSYWVERQIETRRQACELGFPDMLDMLLICVEAGNGLDQATTRVTQEIKTTNPVLGDELGVVIDELRAGKSRPAVFRDFADRVNVPDISAFAAVLRQSDEFGVSIAETLRIYASEMRNKRVMRAEEKANMMPIKLALGSIAFTIPPIMLIMAGPPVVMILRAFAGLGG